MPIQDFFNQASKDISSGLSFVLKACLLIIWAIFGYISLDFIYHTLFLGESVSTEAWSFWAIITSIWLWGVARWVKRPQVVFPNFNLFKFLIVNILAPVAVSYILFLLTGQTSITLITVPILGFLSASLNLG